MILSVDPGAEPELNPNPSISAAADRRGAEGVVAAEEEDEVFLAEEGVDPAGEGTKVPRGRVRMKRAMAA